MINVKNGKKQRKLITVFMAHQSNLQHINLQNVWEKDLEQLKELQTEAILQIHTTYLYLRILMHSLN